MTLRNMINILTLIFVFFHLQVFGATLNKDHLEAWRRLQCITKTFEIYKTNHSCYVLFSPSDSLSDWIANIQFKERNLNINCPRENTLTHNTHILRLGVTEGYANDWNRFVEEEGLNMQNTIVSQCADSKVLSFVGWSKGGAFATLSAITSMYQTKRCGLFPEFQKKEIGLVTFGTPRFMDQPTVEYVLESSEDFKLIKKTRYCFDDDWACNAYFNNYFSFNDKPKKQVLQYVHWGDQIGYDPINGVHTHSSNWNDPEFQFGDGKLTKYLKGLISFLSESFLVLTPFQKTRDLTQIDQSILTHLQYAVMEDGINICPMSSFNCSEKERMDPTCYQNHTEKTILSLCLQTTLE